MLKPKPPSMLAVVTDVRFEETCIDPNFVETRHSVFHIVDKATEVTDDAVFS
jgi:hypothetical protein